MVMQADLAELRDQAMASQSKDSTDTDRATQSSDTTIEGVLADMERDPKLAPLAAKVKEVTDAADASSSQGESVDDVLADMARNPQLAPVAAKLRADIHGAPAAAPTPLAAGSLATVTEGEWRMLAAARETAQHDSGDRRRKDIS